MQIYSYLHIVDPAFPEREAHHDRLTHVGRRVPRKGGVEVGASWWMRWEQLTTLLASRTQRCLPA